MSNGEKILPESSSSPSNRKKKRMVFSFLCTVSAHLNVNGTALARCSQQGMALTGFTRTGECVDSPRVETKIRVPTTFALIWPLMPIGS